MSGLHTMGYRPEPGERAAYQPVWVPGLTPAAWRLSWNHMKSRRGAAQTHFDRLARACLDARETPDPLSFEAVVLEAIGGAS